MQRCINFRNGVEKLNALVMTEMFSNVAILIKKIMMTGI